MAISILSILTKSTFLLYYCYSTINLIFLILIAERLLFLSTALALGVTLHAFALLGYGLLLEEHGRGMLYYIIRWSPLQLGCLVKISLACGSSPLATLVLVVLRGILILASTQLVIKPKYDWSSSIVWAHSFVLILIVCMLF